MQGTVYHLERNMAMIWTSDNFLVRVRKQPHFSIGDKIRFTPDDLIQGPQGRPSVLSYRQIGTILAGVTLSLAILIYSLQMILAGFFLPPPAVLVTVDINPSILFSVATDGTIISATAQNQDAQKLKLRSLLGQPFAAALESVVSQVTAAGVIDPADGVLDYVVVTTVDLGKHDTTLHDLADALDQAAIQNRTLSAVNLVLTEADVSELDQARTESMPLGLIAIAEQTGLATAGETIKSFFADPDHAQSIEIKTTGGQLLRVKSKDSPSQGPLTQIDRDSLETAPETATLLDDSENETDRTPAVTIPSENKKSETPAVASPSEDKKDESPAETKPATDAKAEAPVANSPAEEKKAETPAVTKPAEEKKAETPAVTRPAEEKKAEQTAAANPAAEKKVDSSQAPGQSKKQS